MMQICHNCFFLNCNIYNYYFVVYLILSKTIVYLMASYENVFYRTVIKFPGKNQLVGDMLCLGGSLLYAIVTVLQEMMLKIHCCSDYLAILGIIGSIVACTQTFFLDVGELMIFNWYEIDTIIQLGSYCTVQTIFQILQCFMLRDAGSILLHLSFLSADYYTLISGMFIFQFKVSISC